MVYNILGGVVRWDYVKVKGLTEGFSLYDTLVEVDERIGDFISKEQFEVDVVELDDTCLDDLPEGSTVTTVGLNVLVKELESYYVGLIECDDYEDTFE